MNTEINIKLNFYWQVKWSIYIFDFEREKLNKLISVCVPNFSAQIQYIINPYGTISKELLSFKGSHYLY